MYPVYLYHVNEIVYFLYHCCVIHMHPDWINPQTFVIAVDGKFVTYSKFSAGSVVHFFITNIEDIEDID